MNHCKIHREFVDLCGWCRLENNGSNVEKLAPTLAELPKKLVELPSGLACAGEGGLL